MTLSFEEWFEEVSRRLRMIVGKATYEFGNEQWWRDKYSDNLSPLGTVVRVIQSSGMLHQDQLGALTDPAKAGSEGFAIPGDASLMCSGESHAMSVTCEPADGTLVVQILRCADISLRDRVSAMLAMHQALTGALLELRAQIAQEN